MKFKPLKHYRITQQTLPAWRPLLTHNVALIVLAVGGVILLLLGVIFFLFMRSRIEVRVRYDNSCELDRKCQVNFTIPERIRGRTELRYELTKFYQNHRRFSLSRIDAQLRGEYVDYSGMSNAAPYRSVDDSPNESDWILPCGLFAISVFNDTFSLDPVLNDSFGETGIAFEREKTSLFQPLNERYTTGHKWLENNTIFSGGMQDEHFIVWMRTAFLPRIVKTYSICSYCDISPGQYTIDIDNRYPTDWFGGEKWIVISAVSPLGSKNLYLGTVYIVCGVTCLAYWIFLVILRLARPRKLGEPY